LERIKPSKIAKDVLKRKIIIKGKTECETRNNTNRIKMKIRKSKEIENRIFSEMINPKLKPSMNVMVKIAITK